MSGSRREEVDVLRGIALLGICVVNVPILAGIDPVVPPSAPADRAAAFVVAMFFQGKFFVLFSFLFGWGFAVQRAAASATGRAFGPAYARRLAALLAIGVAHALLVFTGDILVLYALLGAPLWGLRNAPPRRLLRLAVALVGAAALALATLGIALGELPADTGVRSGYLGSFADALRQRLGEWPFGFAFVLAFNGPLALAAFCVGLAAARCGFLEPGTASYTALRRRWPFLLAVGLVLNAVYALSMLGMLGDGGMALLGFVTLAVGGPCLASVYLVAVVEAVRGAWPVRSPASAGRLSLSAYVAAGVVAGLLFNGYGLGLYGRVGDAACLVVAVLLHMAVLAACDGWSRTLGRGPLERLLRAVTRAGAPQPATPSR